MIHRLEIMKEGKSKGLDTLALELAITILKRGIKDETT